MSNIQEIRTERRQEAQKITQRRTLYAAGAGLIPFPIVDAAALLGIQVLMIRDIARVFEVDFKEQRVKSLITTLVGDAAAVGLFKIIPGLGTFFGGASAAAAGAAATYALGSVFTQHFSEGGTLLDFDPVKSREFFQKELEKGKSMVAGLKKKVSGEATTDDGEQKPPTYKELLEQNRALYSELLALQQQVADLQQQPKVDENNLQLIEGIGPKVEAALKAAGITDLLHLASAKVETLKSILDKAEGNFNLAAPDSWPQQAKLAVKGDMKALKALQDKLTGGR
ncbi:MAG: DUF697 domain-containing protein [Phaeodactylibacter sp.]|nr:DUF697 domain-containing protein [Phaeodactylibacter sp.]MCB0614594.1 DUF697 domain-containing protein [Phaeodactylibacter sp.]MCB9304739.1 DUF697 domain-containing protein [Lewinellaceae bacterium]